MSLPIRVNEGDADNIRPTNKCGKVLLVKLTVQDTPEDVQAEYGQLQTPTSRIAHVGFLHLVLVQTRFSCLC